MPMYQSAYVVSAAMTSRTMTARKKPSQLRCHSPCPLSARKLRTAWCKSESVENIRDSENTCRREMCQDDAGDWAGLSRRPLPHDRVQECANAYVPRPI